MNGEFEIHDRAVLVIPEYDISIDMVDRHHRVGNTR